MARAESVTCDVCGRVKGEANHWLIAFSGADKPAAVGFVSAADRQELDGLSDLVIEDLCGADCAHKRLQRTLDAQKTPAQPQEAQ